MANRPSVQDKGSNDVENLKGPAKMFIDPKTNELYVADGYGNKRVIVFDADTGSTSGIGAPTAQAGRHGHGLYNPDAPIDQQFRNRCTAPNSRMEVCSMSAIV